MICALQSGNAAKAYALEQALEKQSAQSNELYACFDDFLRLLKHKSAFVRVRGFRLACAQAKWDVDCKIENNLDVLLHMLDDDKPAAVRQYLDILHEVIRCKPHLCGAVGAKLTEMDLTKYKDSMHPLVWKDMETLRNTMCLTGGMQAE